MSDVSDEQAYNPFEPPAAAEPLRILALQELSLSRLARWLIAATVFEMVLALFTYVPDFLPRVFDRPVVSCSCLGANLIVMTAMSWRIGRWHLMLPAIVFGQLVSATCWLTYILALCVATDWQLSHEDWEILVGMTIGSAVFSGIASFIAARKNSFRTANAKEPDT